jgi:aspartate/methionine/tyrosine aminotransferase
MTDEFYRIQRLPPYVFAEVNAMKAAARARGEDIVDLGMGNPDGAPPKHVIDKLAEVDDVLAARSCRGLHRVHFGEDVRRQALDAVEFVGHA